MLRGEEVYVGAPDSVRDYMYVDDHVNAYLLVIKSAKATGQVYNAGTGVGISNRKLAKMIAERIGYNRKRIKFGQYPPGYPYRPSISDQPSIVLDATKIRKALNWSPKIQLSEGINKVISYFQEQMPKQKRR
jgi:nucleoside-diphosphate-sugar epimerase